MAAGDIACGATSTGAACREMVTSDLILAAGPAAVLALGDVQYECGDIEDFTTSFDRSWGRFKSLIHPAVGNHEYRFNDPACIQTSLGAPGYFSYFGAAATPLDPSCRVSCRGYYSFDVGAWHIIALNSNCPFIGGCGVGSPQEQWLRTDLAANTAACTLAFMHHPRFSSGQQGSTPALQALWQALYDANADVVLAGHDHMYERFAPLNAAGTLDAARGLRQFTVGTGGRNVSPLATVLPNSEVRNNVTFGVLQLTLHPTGYEWRFVQEPGKPFTDVGSGTCH